MALEFFRRIPRPVATLGVLPGSFNPPTVAHLSLARSALGPVDELLFVLPRVFPHKQYEGASFAERVAMLEAVCAGESRFSVAGSDGGLFVDIARECRAAYGEDVRVAFVCGRDAAERIAGWDYGNRGEFRHMLREFDMLVAERAGAYVPAEEFRACIRPLDTAEDLGAISATAVRQRIARGEPWEELVPREIVPMVRDIYTRAAGGEPLGRDQ